jgi:hypothetical protein
LKRYGIEIEHVQGKDPARVLVWNDDRRAIQLPQNIIALGIEPNPRNILGDNVDSATPSAIKSKKNISTMSVLFNDIQQLMDNIIFTTK